MDLVAPEDIYSADNYRREEHQKDKNLQYPESAAAFVVLFQLLLKYRPR